MVNLNRKQRTRAGDFFEKSATGMLVGTAIAGSTAGAGVVGTMALFTLMCFCAALWIDRGRSRGR